MTSLLKFGTHKGRERSLLAIYILHSLTKSPKSGYALLAEMKEKTGGLWAPSKGTLYPVLHHLEDEALVAVTGAVTETGKRAKTTYEVTETGRATLETIKERGREGHKKMACCRNLLVDIFGGNHGNAHGLLFDIHAALEEIPPERGSEAARVLERCIASLKKLNDAQPNEPRELAAGNGNGQVKKTRKSPAGKNGKNPADKDRKTMKKKTMKKKNEEGALT